MVIDSRIVRKSSETQQKNVSFLSTHRINILGFNMCLRKDWKALTILGTARYQFVNLYNSSETWNLRLLEMKMTFGVIKFNFNIIEIEILKRCVEDHLGNDISEALGLD